jgi:hypothetical protein
LYLLRADRVLTNTAEGAATQAAIAYIVEHAATSTQARAENLVAKFAAPTGRVDPLTGLAERRRRMRPGTRLDVPAGQQYKSGLLGSNNSQIYIDVLESALRLAGSVHAFPEGMLTGSYQNANFASSLTAEGPFVQGRVAEQMQRAERMREMILKAVRHAAKRGRFKRVGIAAFEEMELGLTIEVVPSRVLPRDPDKLAQSLAIQKQNGWVSDKTAINELGRDIDVEVANGLKVGQKPGEEQKQSAATGQAQQSKPQEQTTDGRWLGLSRMQWQRNRKAVADVLNDFASGKTRRQVAKVLLRSVGMPDPDIETMLRDASDGTIETLPPEEFTAVTEAERKTLNRPFRTPDGPKKFAVYVKNDKGNVVKVTFGDPKMSIKRDDPGARRGFRARHNCSNSGPKWKARYWSCRFWSKPSVSKLLKESFEDGCLAWDGRTFVNESWLLKTNPRLLEAFCATGKGGKRNPHCSPKNKGKGKQKPQPTKKRSKAEDSKESPRTQSSEAPKDFERTWEDETKTILDRERSLGIDAYRLSQKEHQREFLKLHEAYHSDKHRKEAIGDYDEMLKNANAGIPDEATREVATQELQVSMRDDYYKQNPKETARKNLSEFTPDEEAIKSRMIAYSKRIAKEEIANWEYQRDLVSDRSKKANDDASAKDAQEAALRAIEHRSKAAHLASVAEALRRGKDVSPGNVLAYLGSDRMPKEETAAFMKKYGSQTTNSMLKSFDSTGRRFQKDVLDSLEYGSQFRSKFLEATQKQNEAIKQRWDEIDRLNKEATNVTNEFSAFKEQAASKLLASGISTFGPVVTFADTRKLPEDHPVRVQYDSYVEKVKGIAVSHQQTLDSINSGQLQAGVHALLAHGDAATANLEVGHWGGQKTEAKVKSATEFLKTVVHPSLMPNGMKVTAALNMDLNDQRAYAKVDEAEIVMSSDDSVDTWVHEIGHVIESNSAVSDGPKMSKTFLYNRARFTQDKEVPEAAHLGGRYGFNEQRVEDKLNRPYAEKWYPDNATEVISMGVEALYSDPVKFATEHPDHFDYTISFLHGKVVQKTPDEPSGDVPEA